MIDSSNAAHRQDDSSNRRKSASGKHHDSNGGAESMMSFNPNPAGNPNNSKDSGSKGPNDSNEHSIKDQKGKVESHIQVELHGQS